MKGITARSRRAVCPLTCFFFLFLLLQILRALDNHRLHFKIHPYDVGAGISTTCTFDDRVPTGRWKRGNISRWARGNVCARARGQGSPQRARETGEKRREDEPPASPRGKLAKVGVSPRTRGKLRSYRLCNLNARIRSASFYRSWPRN